MGTSARRSCKAKEKRGRLGSFLAYCEAMAEMASKEITRLQKRRDFFTRTVERLEGYVELILRNLGKDAKGKWLRLEGNTSSFTLKNLPPSTTITDEAAVPTAYKTVSVTLPAPWWERVVDSLDMELANQVLDAVKKPNSAVVKAWSRTPSSSVYRTGRSCSRTSPRCSAGRFPAPRSRPADRSW